MKNILFTLALLLSFGSYSQSILNSDQMFDKYETLYGQYIDVDGNRLFLPDEPNHENISEFKNHPDFDKIDYYLLICFEGDFLNSNSFWIKYYCDDEGKRSSIKQIFFKNYDEKKETSNWVGTSIKYWRNGKIKKIEHSN